MDTIWKLRQRAPEDGRSYQEIAAELGVSPVVVRCMCNRGVTETEAMRRYLHPDPVNLYDPMQMKGMAEAVALTREELSSGDAPVAIASDYDCDGIFSAYVLKLGLEALGAEVRIFTPDRVTEGYGLNRRIVDDARQEGCRFLITCDNGIAAVDAVRYAKEQGMRVLVTDHHEPQAELPPADVILDPKQEGETYPFNGLCGAGVAYKLICALFAQETAGAFCELERELLGYTAIATVADVMELIDENRIIVKNGLYELEHTSNCGLRALLREQGLEGRSLRASDIGFILGPCFNSSGRLTSVKESFDVLTATDEEAATAAAVHLHELNEERKRMTDESVDEGIRLLIKMYPDAESGEMDDVLLIHLPGVHESVVGLIAGKIKERFNHPVVVFTDAHPVEGIDEKLIKGSGRSIPAYHMFDRMNRCGDIMVRFGGHAMAAGLTIREKDLDELRQRLNTDTGLEREDFIPVLTIDVPTPVSYLSEAFIGELEAMGPFGNGNPRPVFAEKGMRLRGIKYMGAENQHIKLQVESRDGVRMDAVAFSSAGAFRDMVRRELGTDEAAEVIRLLSGAATLALAYQPEINEFRDRRTIQLMIRDWVIEKGESH